MPGKAIDKLKEPEAALLWSLVEHPQGVDLASDKDIKELRYGDDIQYVIEVAASLVRKALARWDVGEREDHRVLLLLPSSEVMLCPARTIWSCERILDPGPFTPMHSTPVHGSNVF